MEKLETRAVLLGKDPGWKKYHSTKMVGLTQTPQDPLKLDVAVAERAAAQKYRAGSAIEASDIVQRDLDQKFFSNDSDKGWFSQLAARYLHSVEPARAQETQRRAFEWNKQLFRPVSGVRYQRLIARTGPQAQNALAWIQGHVDPNAVTVAVESLVNRLVFGVHHTVFEGAWLELGTVLGFRSEWPEDEQGKGPDGLWALPDNHYLLTEVKNEAEPSRKEIYQGETEQMGNSLGWFESAYGKDAKVTLLMVHRVNVLAKSAFPPEKMMVMTPDKLMELHTRLRAYAAAVASKSPETWTVPEIGTLLMSNSLDAGSIRTKYCVQFRR